MSGDVVDTTHPINAAFIESRKITIEKRASAGKTTHQKNRGPNITPPKVETKTISTSSSSTAEDAEKITAFQEKNNADIEKKKIETKIKTVEYQRLIGSLVPLSLMQQTITELGKSFITKYKDGADSFLIEIGHTNKLAPAEESRLRGVLVDIINKVHKEAITEAKKTIRSTVEINNKSKK